MRFSFFLSSISKFLLFSLRPPNRCPSQLHRFTRRQEFLLQDISLRLCCKKLLGLIMKEKGSPWGLHKLRQCQILHNTYVCQHHQHRTVGSKSIKAILGTRRKLIAWWYRLSHVITTQKKGHQPELPPGGNSSRRVPNRALKRFIPITSLSVWDDREL